MRDRDEDSGLRAEETAQKRAPREVDRYLCRELAQFGRQTLDPVHEERHIGKARALRAPRAARKAIGARVDRDREGLRLGSRAVENVAAVPRANVNDDATERGG